jgi:hypothetical protein
MALHDMLSRFVRSFRTRGVVGTLKHYGSVATHMVSSLTPAGRRERRLQRERDAQFAEKLRHIDATYDSAHQLDTGGKIELNELSIDSESKLQGVFYQAVFPERFREWISTLNIDARDYLFIDIGAGKGRALFLAQDLGFKSAIGVEFARQLVEVCRENIRRRASDGISRPPAHIVHMDGLLFELPEEPAVLFLNNPFEAELMARMAERIRVSLSKMPRPLKIVYGNPLHDSVIISGIPGLRRLAQTPIFNTYEWDPSLSRR